ncbi:serine/threonine-protein kinase [Tautonia plasticadhaerens]|uniref:Serine/threonine-protein kinase PknD n=1 Tax=Tautonia plasticadhaerens TaxID=2527974 RepID=A0A518HFM3_9BACT|nr:serine/threonine-protein kinase [Tautonia plasticadhaerens]QDV39643.1 Serine/threonine-protein kinase PknD [Tautonia plasticadhaerens]
MAASDRDLLFGLLALQNGLIDQVQLVGAFQAWTRDRGRALDDHLVALGHLEADARDGVAAMLVLHLKKNGGDTERSLASLPAGRSTRDRLAALADPELTGSVARIGGASDATEEGEGDAGRTTTYSVGTATSEGQRFRILRPHARGGLGAVFVALDDELHREVALKKILDGHADDPTSRARFLAEAEITGGLEHPGIVPVYGLGSFDDGRPYYAMRFIRGDSLKEAIGRFHGDESIRRDPGRRSLELRKLLRRFLDVCNAIEYAHARGVLHRDIKPGNVIVGRHGETLVVDWGLAKASGHADLDAAAGERPLVPSSASGSAETLPGSALGTPAYMSPEQARGDLSSLGPASDVYSLGATLYCLLTGKPPFEGDDVGAVLRAVDRGELRPPRQHDPAIDPALEAICLKAMATRPEGRYPRARALAEDVERWMADEPNSSYRDPPLRRAGRWARRHRPLVAGAAALLVSAVAGLSVGAALIDRERSKAEANFRQARAAVDEYFTTVSESTLLNVPGLQPLRKELLDAARRYYRDFLRERGDDPAVRAEAASASFRVGWISQGLGEPEEAAGPYRIAADLYEQLARDHPDNVEYRRLLAIAHGAQGLLAGDDERTDEAMAAHRKALEIRKAIAKERPDDALALIDVARTHRNIGKVLRDTGRPDEALAEWDRAVAIARPLLDRPLPRAAGPNDLTGRNDLSAIVREDLGSVLLDRAVTLRESGRHAEARSSWEQARDLFEGLCGEQPGNLALRSRLADCYADGYSLEYDQGRLEDALGFMRRALKLREAMAVANPSIPVYRRAWAEDLVSLGWVLRLLGREAESLEAYRKATDLAEALLAEEEGDAYTTNLLAKSLNQRATILALAGRAAEALPLARRAVEVMDPIVREQPERIFHVSTLGNALRGLGRVEDAVGDPIAALAAFERAVAVDRSLADRYPACRYNLACSLALIVPLADPGCREAQALRAMAALRQARGAGYSNLANMKADPDLDPLRDREDFQHFLLNMAFPADPFARGR